MLRPEIAGYVPFNNPPPEFWFLLILATLLFVTTWGLFR